MEKKYKLTDETINIYGRTLHRIKALKDFNDVKKGDLGGFIEKEDNLSHKGNCWIYDNAHVCDNTHIYDNARVYDNTYIFGNACVCGDAYVYGNACIYGNVHISGNVCVYNKARVCGNVSICDNVHVYDKACVSGNAFVCNNVHVYDDACVSGYAHVSGNVHIFGNVTITDRMYLSDNAYVKSLDDICYISSFGSENMSTTFFRCIDNTIKVSRGCFLGTLGEFRDKVKETYGNSKYANEYLVIIDAVKIKFNE